MISVICAMQKTYPPNIACMVWIQIKANVACREARRIVTEINITAVIKFLQHFRITNMHFAHFLPQNVAAVSGLCLPNKIIRLS